MTKPKNQKTTTVSSKQIQRQWHYFDAKDKIVGRLATEIAKCLTGKLKPNYVTYLDMGDFVVVQNAALVKFTGKKQEEKIYSHHTHYPKGLRQRSAKWMFETKPTEILRQAIKNMLPKNKLRSKRLARLKIFAGTNHPYQDKFKKG